MGPPNVRPMRPPSVSTPSPLRQGQQGQQGQGSGSSPARPADTPLRAALRQAIADRARLREAHEAAKAARVRASQMVADARAALRKAEEQVELARQEQTRRMTDAARSGEPFKADGAMADARARVQQCQDDLDAASAALAAVEAQAPALSLSWADRTCATAANALLLADAGRLLAEARELQEELVERRMVLRYFMYEAGGDELAGAEMGHRAEMGRGDELMREVRSFLRQNELPGARGTTFRTDWDGHPAAAAVQPWRQARALLEQDPEAPLPA